MVARTKLRTKLYEGFADKMTDSVVNSDWFFVFLECRCRYDNLDQKRSVTLWLLALIYFIAGHALLPCLQDWSFPLSKSVFFLNSIKIFCKTDSALNFDGFSCSICSTSRLQSRD